MILDVAGYGQFIGIVFSLELTEQIFRRFAQDVDQYVEASPVRHAQDELLDSLAAAKLYDFLQHRDQTFCAFQGESFLTDVPGVQIPLYAFGSGQVLQ